MPPPPQGRHAPIFNIFVDMDKEKKGASLDAAANSPMAALQMDKKDKTLSLIISTVAKFGE